MNSGYNRKLVCRLHRPAITIARNCTAEPPIPLSSRRGLRQRREICARTMRNAERNRALSLIDEIAS